VESLVNSYIGPDKAMAEHEARKLNHAMEML
jgi:hypothetical protein